MAAIFEMNALVHGESWSIQAEGECDAKGSSTWKNVSAELNDGTCIDLRINSGECKFAIPSDSVVNYKIVAQNSDLSFSVGRRCRINLDVDMLNSTLKVESCGECDIYLNGAITHNSHIGISQSCNDKFIPNIYGECTFSIGTITQAEQYARELAITAATCHSFIGYQTISGNEDKNRLIKVTNQSNIAIN
jgi:hypothetical protein